MKLTSPQRKVLQAIASGQVHRLRSTPRKLYPITPGVSEAVLDRLFALALVQYDEGGEGLGVVGTYSLTDAGRAALPARTATPDTEETQP